MATTYMIRMQYGFHVQASNREEAFRKAVGMIKEKPEMTISSVEMAGFSKKRRTLIGQILFGV